jgi:hypothetical protein
MEKSWFEMKDYRKRDLNKNAWIPLRASQTLIKEGKCGYDTYTRF